MSQKKRTDLLDDTKGTELNRISVISDFSHSPNENNESRTSQFSPRQDQTSPSLSVRFQGSISSGNSRKLSNKTDRIRRWSSRSSRSSTHSTDFPDGSRKNSERKMVHLSQISRNDVPTLRKSFLNKKKKEYEGKLKM